MYRKEIGKYSWYVDLELEIALLRFVIHAIVKNLDIDFYQRI